MFTTLKIFNHTIKVVTNQLYHHFMSSEIINPITHSVWPHSNWSEPITILPLPIHLYELRKTIKTVCDNFSYDCDLSKYIQLTRFIQYQNLDRLSCDWCSVVNGSIEFIVDSFKQNSAHNINKLNSNLNVSNGMLLRLANKDNYDYAITDSEIEYFIKQNQISFEESELVLLKKTLKKFIELKNIVGIIESRWCPFRYLSDIAYQRHYWGTDVEEIAKLLSSSGRIDCTQCVPLVNQKFGIKPDKLLPSVFEDYVNELIEISSTNKQPS